MQCLMSLQGKKGSCKKTHQRLNLLRQVNKQRVRQSLLVQFQTAMIQSILSLSITVWCGNTLNHTLKQMYRIITGASQIITCKLLHAELHIHTQRTVSLAIEITDEPFPPSSTCLSASPLWQKVKVTRRQDGRLNQSFCPEAIQLLNTQKWLIVR